MCTSNCPISSFTTAEDRGDLVLRSGCHPPGPKKQIFTPVLAPASVKCLNSRSFQLKSGLGSCQHLLRLLCLSQLWCL